MAQEPNLYPDPAEDASFFSDVKVLISLLAFVISVLTLGWGIVSKIEQDKHWKAINRASLVLQDGKMLPTAKMTLSEVAAKNWGYQPTVFHGDLRDESFLFSTLLLRDAKTAKPLEAAHRVDTVDDAVQEIMRLNLQADEVKLARVLRPAFTFTNIGRTPASRVSFTAEMKDPSTKDSQWHSVFAETQAASLGPSQSLTLRFEVALPVDEAPKTLPFRWHVEFEDTYGTKRTADMAATWDWGKNLWSYPSLAAAEQSH
ncbi:MAG: hypothetical protein KGI47_06800 [Betaproteobacteria bacterium]|nr:hypothetical protein [Betaproteobacteria bacterium]MDE2623103.1 hypothetical protein [Betaproteobacteria bacterium]